MSDPITLTRLSFIVLIGLFLLVRGLMTVTEIHTAESSTNTVPEAFASKVSLERHRRSVQYTAHVIQYEFLSALFGTVLCLLLTLAGGFAHLLHLTDAFWGATTAASFVLAVLAWTPLVAFDGVINWLKGDRLNLTYGYETGDANARLRTHVVRSVAGSLFGFAFLWWGLVLIEAFGRAWWTAGLALSLLAVLWSEWIGPYVRVLTNKHLHPMPETPRRYALRGRLADMGFVDAEIMLLKRPEGWYESNALLGFVRGRARFVLFEDTDAVVTDKELEAVAALAAAPVVQHHCRNRTLFFSILAVLVWETLGWLLQSSWFYDALHIPSALSLVNGVPRSGMVVALLLTVLPVALYSLVFVLHGFTRYLAYATDRFALARAGEDALIDAIVRLHRDNRNSLTPNPLYSLANHRRPHVTLRVRAVKEAAERLQRDAHRT
ncbi:MAG: hypothetical protein J6S08_00100 [Duodenibacillus sp.]|nr:hypothetical protein [Duodenibacillus sp.]